MTAIDQVLAVVKRLEARLDAAAGPQPVAVRRAVAAKMMGISRRKLEQLIAAGKVRTAEDAHLVPVAEVRRYCQPKVKRERRPSVGHRARNRHVDAQSDEAWDDVSKRVKAGAR